MKCQRRHKPNKLGIKHCNLYDRIVEKRAAVDLWSNSLLAILKGKKNAVH